VAKAEMIMPDDFLDKIGRLGERTDEIIPKVLEAGGEVALVHVKSSLRSSIGRNLQAKSRSTGELEAALGISPALIDRHGNFNIKIGFREPRRGVKESNAMIANILEFGKHNQPPRPFMKPAKAASRTPAIEAMKQKLDEEINKVK
jgi:hypothetical protein